MFPSLTKYAPCAHTICYPVQRAHLLAESGGSVRYIHEVDQRMGELVRLYAIVQTPSVTFSAEILVDQIRTRILPADRTLAEHPMNNSTNNAELSVFLGSTLTYFYEQCLRTCSGKVAEMPNIAVAVIRRQMILCAVMGQILFTVVRRNDLDNITEDSEIYSLFSNCNTLQEGGNFLRNVPVHLFSHQIESSDLRFYMFTMEAIHGLLQTFRTMELFTGNPDDLIWSLYMWQTATNMKHHNAALTAGFLLIDELGTLVTDNSNHPEQGLCRMYCKSTRAEEQFKSDDFAGMQGTSQPSDPYRAHEYASESASQFADCLESLGYIKEKESQIKMLIYELYTLHRSGLENYMKHQAMIQYIEKKPVEEAAVQEKIDEIKAMEMVHFNQLHHMLFKIMKYDNMTEDEIFLDIRKMEEVLSLLLFGSDDITPNMRRGYRKRISYIMIIQSHIIEYLESLQATLQLIGMSSGQILQQLEPLEHQVREKRTMASFWKKAGGKFFKPHEEQNEQ